jgi:hypothetical protein
MLESILDCCEDERMTLQPCSRQASVTQKPIPLVPPITRTRAPESLLVYFCASDIVCSGLMLLSGNLVMLVLGFRDWRNPEAVD